MGSAVLAEKIRVDMRESACELVQSMDKLAQRMKDPKNNLTESEVVQSIDYLRSDLLRLSGDLDQLRKIYHEGEVPIVDENSGLSIPMVLGGLALGILLEKP